MNRTINRLKLIFLGVFAVLAVATMVWQIGWVWPQKNCLEQRKWWDNGERVCAQPVLISDITGRVIADKAARDAAIKSLGRTAAAPSTPSVSPPASK